MSAITDGPSRRDLFRLAASGAAAAGLAACGEPPERVVAYVTQPEAVIPGRPQFYATAALLDGYAQPVLAETHMGRPTRLDGNPRHPLVDGRIDVFAQAAVATLYDPARSTTARHAGRPAEPAAVDTALAAMAARWRGNGGTGLRLLTGAVTSPTLLRLIAEFQAAYPRARWHAFEPVGPFDALETTAAAFGRPLDLRPRLDRAEVVVALGADPLGPGPAQVPNARGWTERRGALRAGGVTAYRLLVAESTPSLTGAVADRRLPIDAGRLPPLLVALAAGLGIGDGPAGELSPAERTWLTEATEALRGRAGRSLLLAGPTLPAPAHALAHAVNAALGNLGTTVEAIDPVAPPPPDGARSLEMLAAAMMAGEVEDLVILGSDPLRTAPGALDVATGLARVPNTLHAGLRLDGTGSACGWHIPLAHELESWGDARAVDGTATIQQPLIRPLYDGLPAPALLTALLGRRDSTDEAEVRATWEAVWGTEGFEERWRGALRMGFVEGSAFPPVATATPTPPPPLQEWHGGDFDLLLLPDSTLWDGRFAGIGWLEELPQPLTTLSWDRAVLISPALAAERGLKDGDRVELTVEGRSLQAAVLVLPGQAARTLAIPLSLPGAFALRRNDDRWLVRGVALRPLGDRVELVTTQLHFRMDGHDTVRTVPTPATVAAPGQHEPQPSLYPAWKQEGAAWGMVIDLDACIGCNACVIACQAENNIPTVGREEVRRGREMHWIRIDHYREGPADDPRLLFQPVPCMHCEKAPCELGCPVNATVHGPEGLNEMAYNRCIGTRTCGAYCPYEVRRFNWFDYTGAQPASMEPQRNPDVTVRARGVMEKCTYCVQRINAARIDAKTGGAAEPVRTACQSACPTSAIVFGDLSDPESEAARVKRSPRHYAMLHELGTRPRTTYLARIADPGEAT